MIDPPRQNDWRLRRSCRAAAPDIGTSAAVHVHQVGLGALEQPLQPPGKKEVEFAAAWNVPDPDIPLACRLVDGAVGWAHEQAIDAAFLETLTGATLWNKEIYYINELPSKVLSSDVTTIVTVSFVLTLLAALYPSWRASRVNPAEALRYE